MALKLLLLFFFFFDENLLRLPSYLLLLLCIKFYAFFTLIGKDFESMRGLCATGFALARVYSSAGTTISHAGMGGSSMLRTRGERDGSLYAVANDRKAREKKLRRELNALLYEAEGDTGNASNRRAPPSSPFDHQRVWNAPQVDPSSVSSSYFGSPSFPQKKLVDLPGVERRRDLPADPLTRLFFQHKGDHALYYGTYDYPSEADKDRVQLEKREPKDWTFNVFTPMYDFCHRIREACEQRKRFVIVPSTVETKGCALVMRRHGLVAGFRDFHNDRAFAVELKYFQNASTINVIEPCSYDGKTEFEWSPKMMRRLLNTHGIHNRLVIYICRTADNRVIDHIQAVKEHIGGRGLMMVH